MKVRDWLHKETFKRLVIAQNFVPPCEGCSEFTSWIPGFTTGIEFCFLKSWMRPCITATVRHRIITDHIICREIEFNIENKDLELAFYRASGPSVRYKLFTKRLITAI